MFKTLCMRKPSSVYIFLVQVSVLVNEAARDINFYMQKAPLFDFTILNSSPGYFLILFILIIFYGKKLFVVYL